MPIREELRRLLHDHAILRGRFILSSGETSDYYIDARRVTLSGVGARLVGTIISEMVRGKGYEAVGGLTLGADPIVTSTSLVSTQAGAAMEGLLVRKQQKEHGTGRRIEGPLRIGMKAFVVEDTSTTGGSALEAVSALREAGLQVDRVISLIDRDEGAERAMTEAGVKFDSVFTVQEVIAELPPVIETAEVRYVLQTDGASIGNPGPAGAGWRVLDTSGTEVDRGSQALGRATSNIAEYRALILGLEAVKRLGGEEVTVRMDSQLVVNQMKGSWKVKDAGLAPLFRDAHSAISAFKSVVFEWVPRDSNAQADRLASSAASRGKTTA